MLTSLHRSLKSITGHAAYSFKAHKLFSYTPSPMFFSAYNQPTENVFLPHQTLEDQRIIEAKFKHYPKNERDAFIGTNCLISLSIGKPVHSGPHLAATLALVEEWFDSCVFVLGDTLQRHTLALNQPDTEENLYIKTKKMGDDWLENNIHILRMLTIPWKIVRWDHYIGSPKSKKPYEEFHPQFVEHLKIIKRDCESFPEFRRAFEKNIHEFIERSKARGELQIPESQAEEYCWKYLQEESAAMCRWVHEDCQYELYANGRTDAMEITYKTLIKSFYPELLKPISLRFTKKNNVLMHSEQEKEAAQPRMLDTKMKPS